MLDVNTYYCYLHYFYDYYCLQRIIFALFVSPPPFYGVKLPHHHRHHPYFPPLLQCTN
jgi:hypothetical protein